MFCGHGRGWEAAPCPTEHGARQSTELLLALVSVRSQDEQARELAAAHMADDLREELAARTAPPPRESVPARGVQGQVGGRRRGGRGGLTFRSVSHLSGESNSRRPIRSLHAALTATERQGFRGSVGISAQAPAGKHGEVASFAMADLSDWRHKSEDGCDLSRAGQRGLADWCHWCHKYMTAVTAAGQDSDGGALDNQLEACEESEDGEDETDLLDLSADEEQPRERTLTKSTRRRGSEEAAAEETCDDGRQPVPLDELLPQWAERLCGLVDALRIAAMHETLRAKCPSLVCIASTGECVRA